MIPMKDLYRATTSVFEDTSCRSIKLRSATKALYQENSLGHLARLTTLLLCRSRIAWNGLIISSCFRKNRLPCSSSTRAGSWIAL